MNYIDVLIVVIFIWFGFRGFTKGLVIELVSILALTLGVYGGLKFSDNIATYLVDNVSETYIPILSFTVVFLAIVVLVYVIGKLVERIINLAALTLVNKLAGASFGVLKMAVLLSVLITIIESYDQKMGFLPQKTKQKSLFYKPMLHLADVLLPAIEKSNLIKENTPTQEEE